MPESSPKAFSIAYNADNLESLYSPVEKANYSLIGEGNLLRNEPLEEKLNSMGFSWYGVVAFIDEEEPVKNSGHSAIYGHGESLDMSAFRSGKELNDAYALGRKEIPLAFYVGTLLPLLFEICAVFGIVALLERKSYSEIYSLRLIGAKSSQCFAILFLRSLMEICVAFLVSFILFFPLMASLLNGFVPSLLLGELTMFLYVLLCLCFNAAHQSRRAFNNIERRKKC